MRAEPTFHLKTAERPNGALPRRGKRVARLDVAIDPISHLLRRKWPEKWVLRARRSPIWDEMTPKSVHDRQSYGEGPRWRVVHFARQHDEKLCRMHITRSGRRPRVG